MNKKIKILNIIFSISAFLLMTSLIVAAILLCNNQNKWAAICFAVTFSSMITCVYTTEESKKIEDDEKYYTRKDK